MIREAAAPVVLTLSLIALVVSTTARARPVPTGRYVEIPYGVSVEHPWRTGGGDAARTWRSPARAGLRDPEVVWRARVGTARASTPAIASDGTAFYGTASGLAAVARDGTVRWSLPLGVINTTPSLRPDGSLAVALAQGALALVGAGGAATRLPLTGASWGSPLVLDDGSVVVASGGVIQRLDADGRSVFRENLGGNLVGMPAASGARLAVPVGETLLWMDLDAGAQRRVALEARIALGPAIGRDGDAWVVLVDGSLVRVPRDGGAPESTMIEDARPSHGSSLAIAPDGTLRFGTIRDGLVAVSEEGELLWRAGNAATNYPGPLLVDREGTVVTVDSSGNLSAIDGTGQVRWRVPVGAHVDQAPAIDRDGTIHVPTVEGIGVAFR